MTTPPPNKFKGGLVGAGAYIAGLASAGSGLVPPLIVEGDAPVDSPAWHCKAQGPILNAQRICVLDDMEDVGEDTPVVEQALDAGQ